MLFKKTIIAVLAYFFILSTAVTRAEDAFEQRIYSGNLKVPVSSDTLKNMSQASTLLISCVDFRLRDETEKLMSQQLQLLDDYNEVSVPGAALAFVSPEHPHWKATVEDIIGLVEKLHNIKRVVLLDHRDCGAFKLVKGHDHAKTYAHETEAHKAVLAEAKAAIEYKFPNLKVYTMLLGLDGSVEVFK